MLAKVWKKALFAICIIACIYNVMYKLVSRTSLEVQLKSVVEQASLIDVLFDNEVKEKTSENNANLIEQESKNKSETIVVIY